LASLRSLVQCTVVNGGSLHRPAALSFRRSPGPSQSVFPVSLERTVPAPHGIRTRRGGFFQVGACPPSWDPIFALVLAFAPPQRQLSLDVYSVDRSLAHFPFFFVPKPAVPVEDSSIRIGIPGCSRLSTSFPYASPRPPPESVLPFSSFCTGRAPPFPGFFPNSSHIACLRVPPV